MSPSFLAHQRVSKTYTPRTILAILLATKSKSQKINKHQERSCLLVREIQATIIIIHHNFPHYLFCSRLQSLSMILLGHVRVLRLF